MWLLPVLARADAPQPVDPATAAAQASVAEAAGPAAAGLSAETAVRMDETVVTARRREELRQETPLSVTAIDEAELRAAQVETTLDLQGLVPNLAYLTSSTGQDVAPFIRGVGALPVSYLDQGVGTYVDGASASSPVRLGSRRAFAPCIRLRPRARALESSRAPWAQSRAS